MVLLLPWGPTADAQAPASWSKDGGGVIHSLDPPGVGLHSYAAPWGASGVGGV